GYHMFHESTTQAWRSIPSSACHVQDGVRFLRVLTQLVNRLGCRQHEQLDMAAPGFLFHFVHDRQAARSGADTRLLHFHRIFSSAESGVWLKASRNFFEGFFLRLRTCPRSMTTSCS